MKLICLLLLCLCLMPVVVSAENETTYLLAKGDTLSIPLDEAPWTIWIFSRFNTDHYYDIGNAPDINSTYFFELNADMSESLNPGEYFLVKHFPGQNGIKELSYVRQYNNTNQTNEYLTSPFKGVPDIEINGWQPAMVQSKLFEQLSTTDDKLVVERIIVEDPLTVVKSIDRDGDKIYLSGISNLQKDSFIKIVWDSDKLVSESDYFFNTFYTYVKQDRQGNRYWETAINVTFDDLSVGKHWVDIIARNKTTTAGFYVGELEKPNKPVRNETIRYLNDGVVITPTPEIIRIPEPYEVTVIQTVIITTPPFPKNALGEEYNPFVVPDINGVVAPLVMVLIGVFVLRGKVWK